MTKKKRPKIREYVLEWNNKYPWDYRWRRKNGVAFGSERHLSTSFLQMKIELIEDQEYEKAIEKFKKRHENVQEDEERKFFDPNNPFTPETQSKFGMEDEEIDEAWDNLNLEDFKD